MRARVTRKMDLIRISWLAYGRLFDFDKIEIIQVTDEDVERFAIQIGNDVDKERRKIYSKMLCLISSDCGLSENTIWILTKGIGLDVRDINSVRDRYRGIKEVTVY